VPLLIDGVSIDGRPIEFDSAVADYNTMKNAFGEYVKPSKVVSVCPGCGHGLVIDVKLSDPPFSPVKYSCQRCKPTPPALVDPFMNPLVSGRAQITDLDPLSHNLNKPLNDSDSLVGERFKIPINDDLVLDTPNSILRSLPLEAADDISEEVEFDDSDMLDINDE